MRLNKGLKVAAMAVSMAVLAGCGGSGQGAAASKGAGAQAAPSPQDPHNPLIGKWRFAGVGSDPTPQPGCATDMVFTATQQTLVFNGVSGTNAVTYSASPSLVYVIGDAGIDNHVTYKVLDASHVQLDAPTACTFVRVG
jgi:hypothetical protein